MNFASLRVRTLLIAGFLLSFSATANAQKLPDEPLIRSALIIRVVDQLSEQCKARQGFNPSETKEIATWESEQNVATVRTQANTLSSDYKAKIDQAATQLVQSLGKQFNSVSPCKLAATLVSTEPGKLATTTSRSPSGNVNPQPSSSSRPKDLSSLVSQIDSFGFDTYATVGVGGFIMQAVRPVVLFRNGDALKEVKGLNYAGGIDAHRRDHPDEWTRWRRSGKGLELQTSKGWKALPFSKTYQALPDQFRLNGTYRSLSGTGNIAVGGSSSVAAWRTYTFSPDGRVMRDGGAGASTSSVATASSAPNLRGRYQVRGLVLQITYDDGSVEESILIADPSDPKTAIWLDGKGYSRRR